MKPQYKVWESIKKEEYEEKFLAQEKFCHLRETPIFLPADYACPYCKKNILDLLSEKECAEKLITGCPWCSRSFVD